MRGIFLFFFSFVCVVGFSVCLFFGSDLLMFWLFLELGALSLIPSFFMSEDTAVLGGLFTYIIVSGLSSSLIVSGILFDNLLSLTVVGFLMKFGVFPFMGWVYTVFAGSNWVVIWLLSTILKVSFIFFSFFLGCGGQVGVLYLCCVFSFVLAGLFIWLFTLSWVYYWCHVVISSSAAFLCIASEISLDYLLGLFLFYVFWVSLVIWYLSYCDVSGLLGGPSFFLFVFLLVSFPGSLSLFYKLIIGGCIYSVSFVLLFSWVFYNVSEQFFLVKVLVSESVPRSEWSGVSII